MRASILSSACIFLAGVACGGSTTSSGFDNGNDGGGNTDGGVFGDTDGGFIPLGEGGSAEGGGNASCPLSTQYVYTLAADNTLYKFDPPSLTFTTIGKLHCQSTSTPYSMAVDRNGKAWVVFADGDLFQVDTTNAACTSTSYVSGQSGFITFGMGFSTETVGGSAETLFVSDSGMLASGTYGTTKGLARLDTQTLKLTKLGAYDLLTARAEMTGTGDARLFGAFEGKPYVVAEIDKSSAKIVSQAPQTAINYAPQSSNFAFAFWGGDFWLFVGPGTSTDVFHYEPATKATTKVKTVNFEIVGAGVSTCAPTKPPK